MHFTLQLAPYAVRRLIASAIQGSKVASDVSASLTMPHVLT
jgi:hypothetical protein